MNPVLTAFLTHNPEDLEAYYGRALPELHGNCQRGLQPVRPRSQHTRVDRRGEGLRRDHRPPIDARARQRCSPPLPGLLAFLRCAVDISTIDVPAASAAGVLVGHADKSFVPSTAELALALMLDLARDVSESTIGYRSDVPPPQRPGRQLRGRTAGIIGYGAIGSYLAELLRASRHARAGVRSRGRPDSRRIRTACCCTICSARSDFVLPLAPAASDTANLIDADTLAVMRPGTMLVNVSRGELIDEAAVAEALDSGHLGGLAMDVGRAPDQRPSPDLASRPGVVATPHLGGLTPENADAQALELGRTGASHDRRRRCLPAA